MTKLNASVDSEIERAATAAPSAPQTAASGLWVGVALATAWTLLNAVKPVHVDDTTYYQYARQIAAHPTDPYGFSLMYFTVLVPANEVLVPPVFPYAWAPAIRLFGSQPVLWKLWLMPFNFLFVLMLLALLRRFARGMEAPLLSMTVLSPLFLPSVNLMLDVPAEALSLLAIVLFMRAVDRNQELLAVLAGAVAGVAMQTKYTAALSPAVMLVYALLGRKPRLWLNAAVPAALIFVLWEIFVAQRYGNSHFLLHAARQQRSLDTYVRLGVGLLTQLGATSPALGVLALAACGAAGWMVAAAAVAAALVYLFLALGAFDSGTAILTLPGAGPLNGPLITFAVMGVLILGGWLASARTLLRHRRPPEREAIFLVAWLAIELLGCLVLSPFPAARRLLGIAIAATLLIGRLGSEWRGPRRNIVWGATLASILLGGLFYVVDLRESVAEKQAVAEAFEQIGSRPAGSVIWHNAYWGFQFYAEQAGARQAAPVSQEGRGTPPKPTQLHVGDYVLLVDPPIPTIWLALQKSMAQRVGTMEVTDRVPLACTEFYGGIKPLQHHVGPRVRVTVLRLIEDVSVRTGEIDVKPPER